MNFCPNCGTAVAAEQKFCSNCGQVVTVDSTQVNKPNNTTNRSVFGTVKELFKKKRYRSAAYLIGTTIICFFFANNGVDVFAYIVFLVGFFLGMKIWWDALKELPVSQNGSMIQTAPDNRKTLYILMGVFTFFLFGSVYMSIGNRLHEYDIRIHEDTTPSQPSTTSLYGYLDDKYFNNIGLTRDDLISKLGEPFGSKKNGNFELIIYETDGWREVYSIKEGIVRDVTKYNLGIRPDNLNYCISLLSVELRSAGYIQISDVQNATRFSNDLFTMTILPIQSNAGDYNLGLLAMKNK